MKRKDKKRQGWGRKKVRANIQQRKPVQERDAKKPANNCRAAGKDKKQSWYQSRPVVN